MPLAFRGWVSPDFKIQGEVNHSFLLWATPGFLQFIFYLIQWMVATYLHKFLRRRPAVQESEHLVKVPIRVHIYVGR